MRTGGKLPHHLPDPPEGRCAAVAADRRKISSSRYRRAVAACSAWLQTSPSARRWSRRRRSFPSALSTFKRKSASASRRNCTTSTAQHLVAANLNLMSLRTKAGPGSERRSFGTKSRPPCRKALKELRTFSYLMHPLALQADGLRSTIRQYLDGYAEHARAHRQVQVEPEVRRAAVPKCNGRSFALFRKRWPTSIVTHLHRMSASTCGASPVSCI